MTKWRTRSTRRAALAAIGILVSAVAVAPSTSFGQAGPYASIGVGPGTGISHGSGPAGRLAIVLLDEDHTWSARATGVVEFTLFTDPSETSWDLGLLHGRRLQSPNGYRAVAGGLALVGGMRRGRYIPPPSSSCVSWCFDLGSSYEKDPFLTVGIPFELELGWTPARQFGLGIVGFGNLNPTSSFGGAAVTLLVGAVRR
jgi:hypothetical protein